MARALSLAVFVIVASFMIATASAQILSLIGSIRDSRGPVTGASVYVTRVTDASGAPVSGTEKGPATTAGNGTFSFYDLPGGQYNLRVTVSGIGVWRGQARVPGQLTPIVLR